MRKLINPNGASFMIAPMPNNTYLVHASSASGSVYFTYLNQDHLYTPRRDALLYANEVIGNAANAVTA